MRRVLVFFCILAFGVILIQAIGYLPGYGSFQNKDVANYYLETGLRGTGSANIVNSIVWDFRGYDTLGEETILFTATLGVFLVAKRRRKDGYNS